MLTGLKRNDQVLKAYETFIHMLWLIIMVGHLNGINGPLMSLSL